MLRSLPGVAGLATRREALAGDTVPTPARPAITLSSLLRAAPRTLLVAGLLTLSPAAVTARQGCTGTEGYDALEFWLGEWDVYVGERQVGQSRITTVLQGCAVTEEWTDIRGGEGRSLFYRTPGRPWRQVWVSETALTPGGVKEKELVESLPGGAVRFQGSYPDEEGGSWHDRTTLTPLEGGHVRQVIERSRDLEGWETTFDAVYRPRGSAARQERTEMPTEPPTLASYGEARAVVTRALEVMGGADLLARSGGVVVEAEGILDKSAERQGIAYGTSSPGRFREVLAVTGDGGSVAYDYREDRFDGTWEELREIYNDPDQHLIVIPSENVAIDLRSVAHAAAKRKLMRRFPTLLLREVLQRPADLRLLSTESGPRVAAVLSDGSVLDLTFESTTGVLREAAYLIDYQSFGDAVIAWTYGDYRPVEGLGLFPYRYGARIEGRAFTEMRVTGVRAGSRAAQAFTVVPRGIEVRPPEVADPEADASVAARVDTLAPGVYRIANLRNGFHPLFVEMGDELLAIDAPAGYRLPNELPAGDVADGPSSAWLSERYLDLMAEAVPDKRVAHVVLTHFHGDHGGGIRAFVARGVQVIASVADSAAIRMFVDEAHTLAPDSLARAPRPLHLTVVDSVLAIERGGRRVEIIEVGRNPHTAGMLLFHLPDQQIMFVSDLFDPTGDVARFPKPSHAALDRWLGRWLDQRGYAPAVIYTMHGSGRVTPLHLDRLRAESTSGRSP